jgi:cation diffusion facilitator CzcD-associated flavoprotein CzcO
VRTNRGDDFTARFVSMGIGPLHVPKLPGIPGIDGFEGHAFHTSRWDYAYTGGDPSGAPMTGLADKRVAIIGTGATAIQCIPYLARDAGALYVFQRTPSSVDVRGNHPIDPEWFESIDTPGWQQRWLENFTMNQGGGIAAEDLVMDGWTDLARRILTKIFSLQGDISPERIAEAVEESDHEKMEEIRARVDAVVADPDTAQKLKAWYRQLCKRPCFHDEYLQSYNRPTVTLVDTDGKGVERITRTGVVANDTDYEVDCILYASGFEVGTEFSRRAGNDPVGQGGRRLSDHWAEGMRTLHGMQVQGFPNLFLTQLGHGPNLVSNVPHNFTEISRTVAAVVAHATAAHHDVVEVTPEAEDAWMTMISGSAIGVFGSVLGSADCTPGYYNNEGQPGAGFASEMAKGHPGGPMAFFAHLRHWCETGFEGLRFR